MCYWTSWDHYIYYRWTNKIPPIQLLEQQKSFPKIA